MRFFARGSLYDSSLHIYRQSSNTSRILQFVRYYGVMWSRTCWHSEISKKLVLNRTKPAKNTPLFLFPYMRHSFRILPWVMPLHAHVFSFTHNTVVFWLFGCVHPKNETQIFWFLHLWIKTKCRLHKTCSDRWNKVVHYVLSFSTVSNWLVTLYYKLLHWVSSSSKHGCWRSSLLLYSLSVCWPLPRIPSALVWGNWNIQVQNYHSQKNFSSNATGKSSHLFKDQPQSLSCHNWSHKLLQGHKMKMCTYNISELCFGFDH